MFKFRLYPSGKQKNSLFSNFDVCKCIYNDLLAFSKDSYKLENVSLTKFDYNKYLSGKYPEIHSQVVQNVSDRVHKAFQNFFRKIKDKSCKKKGFPRFKIIVNSITFPQSGFKFVSDKRLHIAKIGNIPIVLHRLPRGKIKTLTIKQNGAGQWFACFSCEIENPPANHISKETMGLDVGLESFATLSTSQKIENPRFLIKSEKKLKRLQRRLSQKKNGSINRKKARFRFSKQHIKISNQRTDFLHKLSRRFVLKYSKIAVENLNIKNMVRNHFLAKSIHDASWSTFIQMLSYKAVMCGGQIVKVNPRRTSKTCSQCGTVIEMPLTRREFNCPSCGFCAHRDHNSAINIQGRAGLARTYTPVDIEPLQQKSSVASSVVEAGTIRNVGNS